MTTTAAQPEADKREKSTPGVAFFANAEPLIRAITNGLLFAGTDDTSPMLTLIRFEFDGSKLQTLATDRYRLIVETVELDPGIDHEGQPPFAFQLQRGYAKQALAALKANKRDKVTLVQVGVDTPRPTIEFRFYEQTASYPVDTDHAFPPNPRALIPDAADAQPRDRVMFNPALLADLAKVQTERKKGFDILDIRLFGTNEQPKPSLIQFTDGPTVVVMPLRPKD